MTEFPAASGGVIVAVALGLVPLLILLAGYVYTHHLYSKTNGKGKVPRGSPWMLPLVGETAHLLAGAPGSFFQRRYKKYGGIYTTHLFGSPTVVAEDPEAQKFFLTSRSFELKLTPNFQRIFGKHGIAQLEGAAHRRVRTLMLAIVGQNNLPKLVATIDELTQTHFRSYQDAATIECVSEFMEFTFSIASIVVSSYLSPTNPLTHEFGHAMRLMSEGWASVDQIGLPGSPFRRALKGRQTCLKILGEVISERRKTGGEHNDLLQVLLDTAKGHEPLSDEQIKDNIFAFVSGSFQTSALSMTWLWKYLHDNPHILQQVVKEQDEIAAGKAPGELLTAADLKNMPLSFRVILETLRLSSFVPFTMREAMEDVEFNGFYIPKGWKVVVNLRHPNFDTETFPNPLKFDPSRFENPLKQGSFLPFGGGCRLCIGNDFAKQELLIFMHRFFTTYSFKAVGEDRGTDYLPMTTPNGGYRVTIYKRGRT